MKRHILMTIFVMALFASCEKVVIDESMTVQQKTIISSAYGEEFTIDVTSARSIQVSAQADWIKTRTEKMKGKTHAVHVVTSVNHSGEERTAFVFIDNGVNRTTIRVSQKTDEMTVTTQSGKTTFIATAGKPRTVDISVSSEEMRGCKATVYNATGATADVKMTDPMTAQLTVIVKEPKASVNVKLDNGVDSETLILSFISSFADECQDQTMPWNGGVTMALPEGTEGLTPVSDQEWITAVIQDGMLTVMPEDNTTDVRSAEIFLSDEDGNTARLCTVRQLTDRHVWIPDPLLRDELTARYDTDGDECLMTDETESVKSLDLSGIQTESLEGLESFRNITSLDISGTGLEFADLSDDFRYLKDITLDNATDIDLTGCRMIVNLKTPGGSTYSGKITAFENQIVRPHATNYRTKYVEDPYRSTDYSMEGQKVYVQKSSHQTNILTQIGIEIHDLTDKDIETGVMDEIAHEICEHMFSKEPMKSFREYYDVYYTCAVYWKRASKGDYENYPDVEMRPEGPTYERQGEVYPVLDYEWTDYNVEVSSEGYRSSTISTCYPTKYDTNNQWLRPERNNELVNHEFVGHLHSGLLDEYLENDGHFDHTYKNETNVTSSIYLKDQYEEWKELASYPEYYDELTTLYEGIQLYATGIYCTGRYLMMGNMFLKEFNAISRYIIWSGIQYDIHNDFLNVEEKVKAFVEYDKINLWINEEVKKINEEHKELTIKMIVN